MDLSVDKIKLRNNLNFKGMKGAFKADDNTPVYKFIAPPFDRKTENVTLEVAFLSKDGNNRYASPKREDIMSIEFDSDNPLELSQDTMRENSNGFAYRYKITDKSGKTLRYVTDEYKKIKIAGGGEMNVFEQGASYVISPKTGLMRHSFLDSDAILENGTLMGYNADFVRNHFNKLGGSIKGLNYLLTNTNELDNYRYIISTPDIGADKISSHKYWPNNQYQCTNIEDFKEFIFELYKRGKGYVADGAFTSQGLQSPMFQHVLKWGEDSPFYHMFKIDGYLKLGILPDRSPGDEAQDLDYLGVRLVNGRKDFRYDSSKPTYIQFFDTRLLSEDQQNSNELIETYNQNPGDEYGITSHQDSIWPYYFEIDPDDKTRLNAFGEKRTLMLKDIENLNDFLTFPNFQITYKSSASGANFWDGNRDIVKMNLSNPNSNIKNVEGFFNARNYLYGVSTFWSETVQSDLILKTAMMSPEEKRNTALRNDISPEDYEKIIQSLDYMESPVLLEDKSVEDYVREFPLQSIETNPDLSAIFAQPDFNKELFAGETGKQVEGIVYNAICMSIPDEYKDDDEYRTYAIKAYAPTVIKNLLAGAMCPKAINDDGTMNLEILKDISLTSLRANNAASVEGERHSVIKMLRRGINRQNVEKISARMKKELQNVTLDDFKLAESIVLQGKAGLNWRFDAAKDIGDLDSVRNGSPSFEYIWNGDKQRPGVVNFWTEFISRAKKANPSAYIISEITDLWSFADDSKNMPDKYFDKDLKRHYESLSQDERNANENKLPYVKEMDFLNVTGSTTSSNYNSYFNNISNFFGADPEHGYDKSGNAGNLPELKAKVENFTRSAQVDTALLSHMFVENHDKPGLLHILPLNSRLFHAKNLDSLKEFQDDAKRLTGGRTDYKNISSRAVAVGLMMEATINKLYEDDEEKRKQLLESLKDLVNGMGFKSSEPNFKRAEAFGNRSYYDVTVKDLFNNKGYDSEEEISKFCYEMLNKSMGIEKNLWETMCALVGTPTMYYGMEFAQAGFESSSKNMHVANRGQAMREMKDKPGFKEFYNEIDAISSLSSLPDLSALRGGHPIFLEIDGASDVHPGAMEYFTRQINEYAHKNNKSFDDVLNEIKSKMSEPAVYQSFLTNELNINNDNNNHETLKRAIPLFGKSTIDMWPVFKYDEKGSRTLSIITNNGVPRNKNADEADCANKNYTIEAITIKDKKGKCPLENGVELKKKVFDGNKFVDDGRTYFVQDGKLLSRDGQPILLNRTVETFYVPREENAKVGYMASLYNRPH